MINDVAIQVVTKYLRKGNMARCLRDILPASTLTKEQREAVADIVHTVIRWKRLYEYVMEKQGFPRTAETYVKLATDSTSLDTASFPIEYRSSCSTYVAEVLKSHEEWIEYINESPPTTLCVNLNTSSVDQVVSLLKNESLTVERSGLPTALQTTSVSKYSRVVQERFAHVQDESSQLVSYLAAFLGESVFDFCAGNGGKSLALASLTQNKKILHAYELNAAKRSTLRQRCKEYGAEVNIEDSVPKKTFDVVLVDAPCTGLGAARRNPEAKYINGAGSLPQTQLALLAEAADTVKPGGFLFYAVCTMTREETSEVIDAFMQKLSFSLFNPVEFMYKRYLEQTSFGFFTLLPQGDIFFLSVLKKPEK